MSEPREITCERCNGTGIDPVRLPDADGRAVDPEFCEECGGAGSWSESPEEVELRALRSTLATVTAERDEARAALERSRVYEREARQDIAGMDEDRIKAEQERDSLRAEVERLRNESVSQRCRRTHWQCCNECEDLDCSDNMSKWRRARDAALKRAESAEAREREMRAEVVQVLGLLRTRSAHWDEAKMAYDYAMTFDSLRAALAAGGPTDPLHPNGRCTCGNVGTCNWCRETEAASPRTPAEGRERAEPVCSTCNDTHHMALGERVVMCTRCPMPCQKCRQGGTGPYCEKTPCDCECHKPQRERSLCETCGAECRFDHGKTFCLGYRKRPEPSRPAGEEVSRG